MIKYSLIFLVLSLAIWSESFSQKQASDTLTHTLAKNVLYASMTGYMMSGSGFSINYDRKITKSLWATLGIGGYPIIYNGMKLDCKLTAMIGKRNSHLELGLGITIGHSKSKDAIYVPFYNLNLPEIPATTTIYPAITVGYRYQNPKGGLIFRTGIGFYEANIGIGYSF